MKWLVFFLIVFFSSIPVLAQTQSSPTITLEKQRFAEGEPVSLRYDGPPERLDGSVRMNGATSVGFTAVLTDSTLQINPATPWKNGAYLINFSKDGSAIFESWITIGESNMLIERSQSSLITPNTPQTVSLSFPQLQSTPSTATQLIEFVPFDAIVSDAGASQEKTPDLIHPRYPFEGSYEQTLSFGSVNPDEHLGMPNHDGVDFALPMGTPVLAADDGEIVPYREVNDYGTTIAVQHAWGQSFYGHLSTASAQIGQKVYRGELLGYSGSTGRSTGPHLHFGMKWNNDQMIDPARYLQVGNERKTAEKKLIFPLVAGARNISYTMTFPYQPSTLRASELSPAILEDQNHRPLLMELRTRHIIIGSPELDHALSHDSSVSSSTLFTEQDGVIFWKNPGESMLKIYDTKTESYSVQSLISPEDSSIAIDEHKYTLHLDRSSLAVR